MTDDNTTITATHSDACTWDLTADNNIFIGILERVGDEFYVFTDSFGRQTDLEDATCPGEALQEICDLFTNATRH